MNTVAMGRPHLPKETPFLCIILGVMVGAAVTLIRGGQILTDNARGRALEVAGIDQHRRLDLNWGQEFPIEIQMASSGAVLAVEPLDIPGIDWERLKSHPHALKGHDARVVRCLVHTHQTLGGSEFLVSEIDLLPSRNPRFPAFALIRDMGQALKDLSQLGGLGDCANFGEQAIAAEFGRRSLQVLGLKGVPAEFLGVLVMGKRHNGHYFPVSLYLVPKVTWHMWRCDWKLTHRIFPVVGYLPC